MRFKNKLAKVIMWILMVLFFIVGTALIVGIIAVFIIYKDTPLAELPLWVAWIFR